LGVAAARDLDLQPAHVLGAGIEQLSMAQLQTLHGFHAQAMCALSEAMVR
jgi:hypothetical protein